MVDPHQSIHQICAGPFMHTRQALVRVWLVFSLLVPVFLSAACGDRYAAVTTADTLPLTIGEHTLLVELATTAEARRQGLMFREDMPEHGGMLFVFPDDRPRSFWMKNTPLPLSIAFLDATGRIINIADMEPFDVTSHSSAGPARYALEVHQGWFAERGIVAGDMCEFHLPEDVVIE